VLQTLRCCKQHLRFKQYALPWSATWTWQCRTCSTQHQPRQLRCCASKGVTLSCGPMSRQHYLFQSVRSHPRSVRWLRNQRPTDSLGTPPQLTTSFPSSVRFGEILAGKIVLLTHPSEGHTPACSLRFSNISNETSKPFASKQVQHLQQESCSPSDSNTMDTRQQLDGVHRCMSTPRR